MTIWGEQIANVLVSNTIKNECLYYASTRPNINNL